VQRLVRNYKDRGPGFGDFVPPGESQIRMDLKNPNPYVREVCRKLLALPR
jgi:hypothetical protein